MSVKEGESGEQPAVTDRWWVETGKKKAEPPAPPQVVAGQAFYRAAKGFDQETARSRLTDLNKKLLVEGNPPEGGWGYVSLAETTHPERDRERIKESIQLPSYARGVFVDCGRSVRLLITGTPVGDRILDLTLSERPSFDCWVSGDWVREAVFPDRRKAIVGFRRFVDQYLSPEGIAAWEALRAQA